MKTITEAIVLHLAKYSDKASILHVYTRNYGRMAYMVYGGKKKKSLLTITSEPLSLVEIEATHSPGREIQTLNNISLAYVAGNTVSDFRRRSISVFIAEFLYRTLRHPEPDNGLFNFLYSIVKELNNSISSENIHLRFLVEYTYYLGIMPQLDDNNLMLDITTGLLIPPGNYDNCFSVEETDLLIKIHQNIPVSIDRKMRQTLLEKLCLYYECHIQDFSTPKSLDILKTVFD